MNRAYRKILYGLGFDAKDGHVRVTRGENYRLYGGSDQTHEMMQEKAVKFNEQLNKRRKTLDEVTDREFLDIARDIGLKVEDKK
jgi:hypothetical protein